ncbi:hypothetical protein FWH09_01945 [Candidatus Saccharibacteria bacterium]|nr:hypothetical protein [Candidatus Saccharibacteria bacterium]
MRRAILRLEGNERLLGLVGVAMMAMIAVFISVVNWQDASLTISRHIAMQTWSMIAFAVIGSIGMGLTAYALLSYIPRRWNLGGLYKVIVGVISVCFLLLCLAPHTTGVVEALHIIFARTMFVFIVILYVYLTPIFWREKRFRNVLILAMLMSAAMGVNAFMDFDAFWQNVFVYQNAFLAIFLGVMGAFLLLPERWEGVEDE